jgi:hypothetical protein
MISYDLTLDLNNDLIIENGDFFIGQTDDQNIEAILLAEKGQFYEFPLLGYGITRRLSSPFDRLTERKAIRESLKRDNYNVKVLNIVSVLDQVGIEVDADKIK